MIGFVRGPLMPLPKTLLHLRQETEARETIRGYANPQGPLLHDAISALEHTAPYPEFLTAIGRLVALRGYSRHGIEGGSIGSWKRPGLGTRLGKVILASGAVELPPWREREGRRGRALIPPDRAPELARALLALASEFAVEDGLRVSIPTATELPGLTLEGLERMGAGRRDEEVDLVVGLVKMAATASQRPMTPGAVLLSSYSEDESVPQSGGIGWIDEQAARQLYESKSKDALLEAARNAAIRDTHVDPPSHECLPEVYSLLLPSSRQFIVDDETDLLAMDFLLVPFGLLPAPKLPQSDWIRPLSQAEVSSIAKRLEDLNRLSFDEFLGQAGEFYRDHHGAPEGANWATELRGALRDDLKKLLAAAAKKGEPVTLVSCNDWLGDKKN
jgi:hypothetical protein